MQETILYQTQLIQIGVFVVNPQEPDFNATGYVNTPLVVFPKNSIWIQHAGSTAFVADATLVNFYNKDTTYQRFAINQSGDYCHWFKVCDAALAEVMGEDDFVFSRENMPCSPSVFLQHLEILKSISGSSVIDSLQVEDQVLQLFHSLLNQPTSHDVAFNKYSQRHKKLVECVKESLHFDLSVNISLQELAQRHHTSPFHLSRIFKKIHGQGLNQYRTQQRLRMLMLDIQEHHHDLMDLAFDYGFSSHSHMSASFKKTFGVSPSACQLRVK